MSEQTADFPYREYMSHPAWPIIDQAITELESNGDLELQTARRYAIGCILKALADAGTLPPAFSRTLSREERKNISWVLQYTVPTSVKPKSQSPKKHRVSR